ncbi:hypothetical protein, partial [Leuconostoc mesenteroides]|uniref:hypothetical protein n=1 Tax=Leuconostoc mesenteroides TaxID=1245 RepID=UPI00235EF9E6
MVAAIIPIAGALISFFFNVQMNEYGTNKETFLAIQDQVRNQQIPKIINFSKNRDKITENQKFNLVRDLASMIYASLDIDKKRAAMEIYTDDPNIGDLGSFNDKLYEIIQDEKNED